MDRLRLKLGASFSGCREWLVFADVVSAKSCLSHSNATVHFFIATAIITWGSVLPAPGQNAMPNSSRECAICHIRWVDTLVRNDRREKIMEKVLDRQAGSGDMCLSCHDGSVVDSRFKVWSTTHHTTDSMPSPKVKIPTDKFPLDEQGRMTCATCHTAHAVPDSSDLKTVIFLRQPNIDSSLCLACHPEHAQKNDLMHPLGRADNPVPQMILDAGGQTSDDGHMIFCQTCHEPHGATHDWMLVLPPSQLCVACHDDKRPETEPAAGAPVHHIGQTYQGFEPPVTLLEKNATFGPNGQLSCLSCHRLHDASGAKPLLIRNNEDSSLCLECHEKEEKVIDSRHDLRLSSPETVNAKGEKASESGPCGACHRIHGWARDVPETNRPHSSGCIECHTAGGPGSQNRLYVDAHAVGTTLSEGMSTDLPVDSATGAIGCLTCHDPHSPLGSKIAETDASIPPPRSFLRYDGSRLCALCHDRIGRSQQAPHDPAEYEPSVRKDLGLHASIGPCRVCHTTHNAKGPRLWTQRTADDLDDSTVNLCGSCHANKTGVADSVHDPATNEWAKQLGFESKGICIDCHPVHGSDEPISIWSSLGEQDSETTLCENCHRAGGPGKPMESLHMGKVVPLDSKKLPNGYKLDSEGRILCTTCHEIHQEPQSIGLLRAPVPELCGNCHEEKLDVIDSVHDPGTNEWAEKLGFVSEGSCVDCHPIHDPERQGGIWELIPARSEKSQLCETCHRAEALADPVETPHLNKSLGTILVSLPLSKNKRIACTSCHDIHQKTPGPKLRASAKNSVLCIECHSDFGVLLNTPHDLRTSAPDATNIRQETAYESGPCSSCHLIHSTSSSGGFWAQGVLSEEDFGRSLCTCCHRKDRSGANVIPKHVDHPEAPLLNRSFDSGMGHMPTFNSDGKPSDWGAISCLTCHEPHGIGTTVKYHKFLRPAEHRQLCADCHGNEALWRFLYYHDDRRNPRARNER